VSELRPAAKSPASGIIGSNTSPTGDAEHQVSFMKSHEALQFLSRAVRPTTVLRDMKMGNQKNKHSHCCHFVTPHC
jgi:hypothetical protein